MPDFTDRAGMLDVLDLMLDEGAITPDRHAEMREQLLAQWARSGVPVDAPPSRNALRRQIERLERERGHYLNNEGNVYKRILRLLSGPKDVEPAPPIILNREPASGMVRAIGARPDSHDLTIARVGDYRSVRLIRSDGVYVKATADPYIVVGRGRMTRPLDGYVWIVQLGTGEAYLLEGEAEYRP